MRSTKFFPAARWSVLVALLLLWLPCEAQFSSNLQGTVTDPSGAVVPNAQITLTNLSTSVSNSRKSSDTGSFRFDSILPGDYQVVVEAPGFEKVMVIRHVTTDETAGLLVTLTVGKSETTVKVSESEQGLNPDETRLQYTLETGDLTKLPLPDRSTITALRTAPGVVGTIETTGSTNTNIPIGQATPDARGNGRPASSNLYLLDRIPITSTEFAGALNIVPNPDMLAEAAIQTTTFSVENGATSSLQVDLTSKNGGNRFHGDVDFTYTSKALEATPNFGALTPFHRKYLLGSLGGPILKDRAFFFGAFEHVDNSSSLTGTGNGWSQDFFNWAKTAFPNSPIATGLFSHLPTNLSQTKVNNYASDFWPANNPGTPGKAACGTASAYFIPCGTPLDITGQFNQNPTVTGTQYNTRLDAPLRKDNDRVYVSFFRVDQKSQYTDPRPDFSGTTPSTAWYISAGYSHAFSSQLINQANFGAIRFWAGNQANPNYAIYPHQTLFCFTCNGFKFFGGPQEAPDSPYFGQQNKEHQYALRDYVSWLKGKHSLRFGFQFQHIDYWQDSAQNYSRPYNTWYSDVFEMLQGQADETALYTISATTGKWQGQYYGAQETQYGAYVQDDWKVTPNLLVSLGLRWDDFGNPSNYGHLSAPYAQLVLGQGGTLQAKMTGAKSSVVSNVFSGNQINNVLPRVGISYAPSFVHKMTLRGGVGLYEDFIGLNGITANLPTSSPARLTLTLHDSAEPFGGCFFCFFGGWHPYTGTSATNGLPDAKAFVGTQGGVAPYGIPYPTFNLTGFTSRGLATGQNGFVYPSDAHGVDQNLKPQKAVLWNFSVNQEGPKGMVFGLLYSGSHAYDLFISSNAFDAPPGSKGSSVLWTEVGKIAWITNGLSSNYNALVATAQQRTGNFSWETSYLWSHTLGQEHYTNPYTTQGFYANSDLDVRNRFTLSGAYEFPGVGAGLVRAASQGWTASTVAIAQSGTPFTVLTGNDLNLDGNKDSSNDIPDYTGVSAHLGGFSRREYKKGIFPKGCFGGSAKGCTFDSTSTAVLNPVTHEGNQPINAFNNPGYFNIDLALQKRTQLPWIGEQKSTLVLRVEALNSLNRANLGSVTTNNNNIEGGAQFGQSTSALNPRIIQLGARFEF